MKGYRGLQNIYLKAILKLEEGIEPHWGLVRMRDWDETGGV